MPSRNNIEIVISAKDNASGTVSGVGSQLEKMGSNLSNLGGALMTISAPIAGAFGLAVKSATDFDESVTNTGAVLGLNRQQIEDLKKQLLDIGGATRAGPQAVADTFYDIVGGVADASTHMAILNAAIQTSQAGNADLGGTTRALISVMNAYKFSASDAALVSNVLTQTVAKGVGTMDDFASAFPQVTGLASSLGIGFDDLGGMMAYLTTQGNSASQSATQLSAMMVALLNPNEAMKKGLQELGYSSGEAAIQALGLTGAYQALAGTQEAGTSGMAKMAGSVEALRGVTSLAGDDVGAFLTTFTGGVEGATQAAEQIQMGSAAAQFDLLKSSVEQVGITAGTALLPVLLDIVKDVTPVVSGIADWIAKNPELTKQIGIASIAVLGLGLGLKVIGGLIGAGGAVFTAVQTFSATAMGGLLISIGAVAAALIALKRMFEEIATFQQTIQTAQKNTASALGPQIQSGQITRQQYESQAFRSAQSQLGDLGARLFWASGGQQVLMQPHYTASGELDPTTISGRAAAILQRRGLMQSGGFASGGYTGDGGGIAGVVHGREWVVPEGGSLVLRGEGGGGGIVINGPVNVYANDPQQFRQRLTELARSQG